MADTQVDTKKAEKFAKIFGYSSQSNGQSFGPSFLHDTDKFGVGNSAFSLVTYVGTGDNIQPIVLKGLLSELPEISCSVKFTEGPGKATQDMIQQLFDNKLFKFINAVGSADTSYKNMISTGALTKEMYNGIENSEFNLKFRIFTHDPMGQSSYKEWINQLSTWAVPSSKNEVTVQTAIKNLTSALVNAKGLGTEIMGAFLTTEENLAPHKDDEKKADLTDEEKLLLTNSKADKIKKALVEKGSELGALCKSKLQEYFDNQTTNHYGSSVLRSASVETLIVTNSSQTGGESFWQDTIKFYGLDNTTYTFLKIEIYDITHINNWRDNVVVKHDPINVYIPLYQNAVSSDGDADQSNSFENSLYLPPNDWKDQEIDKITFTINENLRGKVKSAIDDATTNKLWMNNIPTGILSDWGNKGSFMDILIQCIEKVGAKLIEDAFLGDTTEYKKNMAKVKEALNKVGQKADQIQKIGEKQYGTFRAFGEINTKNGLGEKLWSLYLYHNFLLQEERSFTVYIKDWEVVQSKEFTSTGPIYVDFTITCALDQVYSNRQLLEVLSADLITLGWPQKK